MGFVDICCECCHCIHLVACQSTALERTATRDADTPAHKPWMLQGCIRCLSSCCSMAVPLHVLVSHHSCYLLDELLWLLHLQSSAYAVELTP